MWSAIVAVVAARLRRDAASGSEGLSVGVQRWFAQVIVALAFSVLGSSR